MNTFPVLFLIVVVSCAKDEFSFDVKVKPNLGKIKTFWRTGNHPENIPSGERYSNVNSKLKSFISKVGTNVEKIPEAFDARMHWDNCPSIREIYEQGKCGVCWAVAATSVMSDRICIYSNGTYSAFLSVEDGAFCNSYTYDGCSGAGQDTAWLQFIDGGIVTRECKPFTAAKTGVSPNCSDACVNGKDYHKEKWFGERLYLVSRREKDIMEEIIKNGPVATNMIVYDDLFSHYKSEIYVHKYGKYIYHHSVRVIGWGTENGIPYWLCANSLGSKWGELDGFFKIHRTDHNCSFGAEVVAGVPSFRNKEHPVDSNFIRG